MSLGKAQKQKRNLEAKLAKKREEVQRDYDVISSMENDRGYSITKDGEQVLSGMVASGRFWKMIYGVSL